MKKGARISLIIILIIAVAAAASWYFLFRPGKKKVDSTNTNEALDLGYDSVIDTSVLGEVDPTQSLGEVDSVIEDYGQPDTTLNIDFNK